ncbi:MAG: hypothetical protein R2764_12740 [Bacteroidales bacterium]
MEPAIVDVKIEAPTIALIFEETTCPLFDCKTIGTLFEKIAIKEGYKLADKSLPDFIFEMGLHYADGNSAGGLTSVFLNGKLSLKNTSGKILWLKDLETTKGVGTNMEEAKSKAFEAFPEFFRERVYFQQGIDAIK